MNTCKLTLQVKISTVKEKTRTTETIQKGFLEEVAFQWSAEEGAVHKAEDEDSSRNKKSCQRVRSRKGSLSWGLGQQDREREVARARFGRGSCTTVRSLIFILSSMGRN